MNKTQIYVDNQKLTIESTDNKTVTLSIPKGKAQTFKLKELNNMPFYSDLIQWLYYGQNMSGKKYKLQKYVDKFSRRK